MNAERVALSLGMVALPCAGIAALASVLADRHFNAALEAGLIK